MGKKIIRLTESDLHKIIKESVKRIISESVDESEWQANGVGFAVNQAKKYAPMSAIEMENMPKPKPLTWRDYQRYEKKGFENYIRNGTLHRYHLIANDLLNGKNSTIYNVSFYKDLLKDDERFTSDEVKEIRIFLYNRYGIIPKLSIDNKRGKHRTTRDSHYVTFDDGREPIFVDACDYYSFIADVTFRPGERVEGFEFNGNEEEPMNFSPEDAPSEDGRERMMFSPDDVPGEDGRQYIRFSPEDMPDYDY